MRVRSRSQAVRHLWVPVKKTLAIAMILQQFSPPLARATPPPLNQTGRWVATSSLGFSGTHVALLRVPGSDTAKVFLFGEAGGAQTMKFWRFIPGDTNLITPLTSSSRSSRISSAAATPHSRTGGWSWSVGRGCRPRPAKTHTRLTRHRVRWRRRGRGTPKWRCNGGTPRLRRFPTARSSRPPGIRAAG